MKDDARVYGGRGGWIEEALLAGILAGEMRECMQAMQQALVAGKSEIALLFARGALQARRVAVHYGVWDPLLNEIKGLPWDQALGLVDAALAQGPGGMG